MFLFQITFVSFEFSLDITEVEPTVNMTYFFLKLL